jgi:tetratricopeptide (TPR) repeat protein
MRDPHPNAARLTELGQGRLPRRQARRIVRHLLAGCEACRDFLASILPASDPAGTDYSRAFAAAQHSVSKRAAAMAAERAEARELLRELAVQPVYRQWILVTDQPRFHTWGLCELLLEASREWGFQDPGRALETARLGAEAAERLDREVYGAARVNDLRARACATVANCERILCDFRAAEKSFAKAESLLKSGTGDPLERAGLLLLKASLLGHQLRFEEASRLLDRVIRTGRTCNDPHLCGKALITKGFLAGMDHEPEVSISLLREGIPLVDPAAEPRLLVAAYHNLILGLNEAGRPEDAGDLLQRTRDLYLYVGDRMSLIRLGWLEGKIALALGHLEEAEALFVVTRKELVDRKLGYDTALLLLDLAQVYARQGRGADMRHLAEEMLPIFQSRQIQREVVSVLIVFQKAAALERVTVGMLQELIEYLEESRSAPGLQPRDPF